jgi:hypothetical protein
MYQLLTVKINLERSNYVQSDKYSIPNVPVFFREIKEPLKYLLDFDYYKSFVYDEIVINGQNILKYNPSIYDSIYGYNYVITKTIMPIFNNHLALFGINIFEEKYYYTSLDFYFNEKLINDMYELFIHLQTINKNYCLINSLEVGSLPEVYHFHISYNVMSDINPDKIEKINTMEKIKNKNIYVKIIEDDSHPYCNSYMINIDILGSHNLRFIPKLLYDLRYCHDNDKIYYPQIYFCNYHNKNYLMISFRSVDRENLKMGNKDGFIQYIDKYYSDIFNDVDPNTVYFPLGIFTYKLYDTRDINVKEQIKQFLSTPINIKKLKDQFKFHPNFDEKIKNILDSCMNIDTCISSMYTDKNNINTCLEGKQCLNLDIGVNKLEECTNDLCVTSNVCLNLTKYTLDVEQVDILKCNKLPIIYTLPDIKIGDNKYENGRMSIDGADYYYIKINIDDIETYTFLNTFNENTNYNDGFIKLFNVINLDQIYYYFLFTSVKINLSQYLILEQDKLRANSSMINTIVIIIIYKLINLYKTGYMLPIDIEISDFFVTDNHIFTRDYTFRNNLNVTIVKKIMEPCKFILEHNGNDFYLPLKYLNNDGKNVIDIIKLFISKLQWDCASLHINNILLIDLNKMFLEKNDIIENDIINKFNFANNLFECKGSIYDILLLLKEVYNIYETNMNIVYDIILKKIIDSPDIFVSLEKYNHDNPDKPVKLGVQKVNKNFVYLSSSVSTSTITTTNMENGAKEFNSDCKNINENFISESQYKLFNREKYFIRLEDLHIPNILNRTDFLKLPYSMQKIVKDISYIRMFGYKKTPNGNWKLDSF